MQVEDHSRGFPPIAQSDARILILGSLPGVRSIEEGQYYAHPRNAFWRIMAALAGASGDYEQRCQALRDAGVAVWDVLARSVRQGSLDANIQMRTAQVNDIAGFLAEHANISRICFNGQTAAKMFAARVDLDAAQRAISMQTLPSTSPAHAAMSYEEKLVRWRDGTQL